MFIKRYISRHGAFTFRQFSTKQQDDKVDFQDLKKRILNTSLVHAKVLGFNNDALAAGAHDLGYSSVVSGLFERGPIELVDYAMETWLERMCEELKNQPLDKIGVTKRIKTGVKIRLSYEIPYIRTWPEAMAVGAMPQNITSTTKKVFKISDEIWYHAGDNAVDYNWYTKRILLTSVYASTELYMLTDRSAGNEATWDFLDRRIGEVLKLGMNLHNAKNYGGALRIGLGSVYNMFKPIPKSDNEMWRLKQEELNKRN